MNELDAAQATRLLTQVCRFTADRHRDQKRKGAAGEPYINHLAEVAELVAEATGGRDPDLVAAAYLHDTVEDTATTHAELAERFGRDVADLVAEVTGMAKRAGLAVNTEAPRTQRSPQFAIHTVQVTTRKAELASLLRFYQELSSKAPYLGLEQVSVQGDRGNPGMVNVNMQIASVELLSEAAGK